MGFLQRLRDMIVRIFEHSAYRKTIRELEKLTDHELRDIGLSRSQIRSIALEHHFQG